MARIAITVIFLVFIGVVAQAQTAGIRITAGAEDRVVTLTVDGAATLRTDRRFAEVRVASPEIADVQPLTEQSIYLMGLRRGRTSMTLIDPAGEIIANIGIVVQPDVSELKRRMAELLPGAPIEVRPIGEGVVLSGVVTDAATINRAMALAQAYAGEAVTNLLSVGSTQQVSLHVRIAEINRNAAKELGITLGGTRTGSSGFNITTGGTAFAPSPAYAAAAAFFSIGDSLMLDISIDALESKGFARILAEPNLVALSGSEARFLAGGEVPIPLISNDGNVDIRYRDIGVSLNFRPVVLDDDAISISVSAEVADVDPGLTVSLPQTEIPGFVVRRATTSVEMRDGQSFAIAGLYQDDFTDQVSQVPWLGNVPVIGALFRSLEYQRGETELIVIVSASLVEPVVPGVRIPDPTERMRPPTDYELFLLGRTAAMRDGPPIDGPVGYALD